MTSTSGTELAEESTAAAEAAPVAPALPAQQRSTVRRMPYALERGLTSGAPGSVPGYGIPGMTNERITFMAPCPGCGGDVEWLEVREDTRVRASVRCSCAADVAV